MSFHSVDGLQWTYLATLATRNVTLAAAKWEGPGESDLIRLSGGDLLAVFRVDTCQRYWSAKSSTAGQTWTAPEALPFGSVRPKLLMLRDHRVVLSGGRPGLFMWIANAEGENWTQISVAAVHNRLAQAHKEWLFDADFVTAGGTCRKWNNTADDELSIQGSSAYTSLLDLGGGRYTLLFDKLANGWAPPVWKGKPGVDGDRDYVFSMAFTIAKQSSGPR